MKMRRMNNLVNLFTAMTAFFFGSFLTSMMITIEPCPTQKSGIAKMEPHPELFLIVLVLSAPHNVDRRRTMRETWLKLGKPLQLPYYPEDFVYIPDYDKRGHLEMESVTEQANRLRIYLDWVDSLPDSKGGGEENRRNVKIKHFFAIGTQNMHPGLRGELEREHKQHKDMLLLPRLEDGYANLTEKMLHAIDALANHYDFSYLLKVDDDTYVKMDYLVNELFSYDRKLLRKSIEYRNQPVPQLYWGYFNGRANIKTKGQWSEPNYFLSNRYITYALGGGYVISRKLCSFIANNTHFLTPYVSEDVSMGVWLAPLRHVYRRHDPRFDTGYMPRKCKRQHLVLHKRNDVVMNDLYEGKLCTFEIANEQQLKRPTEYYYDWRKTADKCCDSIVV